MRIEHYENHEITLKFPNTNEMQKAVNTLACASKFEISGISDYDMCKWIDAETKEDSQ